MADDAQALRARVADLEAELDTLRHGQARLERGVVDRQGRRWRLADFLNLGLSRREAIVAIGMLGSGATLAHALGGSVRAAPDGSPGVIGQSGDRVDLWGDDVAVNVLDNDGSAVSVGDSLVPDAASTHDLGSASNPWSALHTGSAAINGQQSDQHRELIAEADVNDASSLSLTFDMVQTYERWYVVEIPYFRDENDDGIRIDATLASLSNGDYEFLDENQSGTESEENNGNQFELLTLPLIDGSTSNAAASGRWWFVNQSGIFRPSVFGGGSPGYHRTAEWLTNGSSETVAADPETVTIESNGWNSADARVLVWETVDASTITI